MYSGQLYALPNTAELLQLKVYAVVASHFAARSCEAFAIEFGQLVKVRDTTNGDFYKLFYERAKVSGPRCPDDLFALISGSDEVAIVDFYISCFREEDRTGRFFVKLVMKASRIQASRWKENYQHLRKAHRYNAKIRKS